MVVEIAVITATLGIPIALIGAVIEFTPQKRWDGVPTIAWAPTWAQLLAAAETDQRPLAEVTSIERRARLEVIKSKHGHCPRCGRFAHPIVTVPGLVRCPEHGLIQKRPMRQVAA